MPVPPRRHAVEAVDPFDLPEWLGVEEVTWTAGTSVDGHRVLGELSSAEGRLGCDVLAGDLAHPFPVLADTWRTAAHQAWTLGEVLVVRYDGRLTLVVPGLAAGVDSVMDGVRRLARAVGARPSRFSVLLRL